MKKIAFIKSGKVVQKGIYSKDSDVPAADFDEIIEIDDTLLNSEYPLEYAAGKVQVNATEKARIDAERSKLQAVLDKVEADQDLTNKEMAYLILKRGS